MESRFENGVIFNGSKTKGVESREKLEAATTIEWTMADNSTATINAQNITDVFIASATRSNELHEKYRTLKEQVNACKEKTDVEKITW